jgi:hypothetical protein
MEKGFHNYINKNIMMLSCFGQVKVFKKIKLNHFSFIY